VLAVVVILVAVCLLLLVTIGTNHNADYSG
jgi:hypothetical protein